MVKVILFFLIFQIQIYASFNESPMEPWGPDSELLHPQTQSSASKLTLSKKISDKMIRFYQNVISPIDGPRSNYEPSSSEYTRQAICKYGFIKGFVLGCDRLLRENKAEWHYPIVSTERGDRKSDPLR